MTDCIIDNCEAKRHGHGLCKKHYTRYFRHGDPHTVTKSKGSKPKGRTCDIYWCNEKHRAKGLCTRHYMASRRGDNPRTERSMFGVFGRTICTKRGCKQTPMGGGYFCLIHFRTEIVEPRRATQERVA